MTQSRASANAASARRRSSSDSEECETKVSTPRSRRRTASSSTVRRESAKTSRFSPRCMPAITLAALPTRADVVERELRRRRLTRSAGATTVRGCAAVARALQPGQQLVGVADRGRQADPLERPAGNAAQPLQHGQQVPAAVVAGEGVHLVDHDGPHVARTSVVRRPACETSIASSDSGVVSRMSGRSRTCRLPRARGGVAVAHRAPLGPATRRTSPAAAAGC